MFIGDTMVYRWCHSARHRKETVKFTTAESKHLEIERADDDLVNLV